MRAGNGAAAAAPVPAPASALPTLAALTAAYVLSQFFRTALAVVAPEIARDLALDPSRLGVLSSAWFWAFAAAQIPIGMALDRWGPRRTVSVVFAAAGLGCALLASAPGLGVAVAGQVLIGVGCAPVFMGSLVVLARFYDARRFALLTSVLLAVGGGGTLIGATPLALAAAAIGWRGAFLAMGVAVVAVAGLLALVVRDRPPGAEPGVGAESLAGALRGVLAVVRDRRLWAIVPMSFTGYAVLVTVRGLWAGPYLAEAFALPPVARGNALLAMSVAMVLGTLAYGSLERRLDRRREPVLAGTLGAIAVLLILALAPPRSAVAATALLALFGALGMTYALLMAQGRRFMAGHEIGRGLTFLNCACFTGAALIQSSSGILVELARGAADPAAAYRALFLFLAALLAAALLCFTRSQDPRSPRRTVPGDCGLA
jgi:predicted MFS family arabinose efflux permease